MKIDILWVKVPTLVVCLILCMRALLFAEDKLQTKYSSDPAALTEAIAERGSRAVVNDLYSNISEWHVFLRHVATGNASWLRVASALYSGTDAGASEMLTLSVGEALENAPENVFKIVVKDFRLEDICSGPDIDDNRYNSYSLAINAINKRQREIRKITNPELAKLAEKCIQVLEKSKAALKKSYDVNNNDNKKHEKTD